jgi:DNA-binding CsgD family transcriptional regulator
VLCQEGPTSALARAKALGSVSVLAWSLGDLDRARGAAEEGLRLSKEVGIEGSSAPFFLEGTPLASFLNMLGLVSLSEGDHEHMAKLGKESLMLNRRANHVAGITNSLLQLAIASGEQGDYEQAEKLYAEGMSLARELDSASTRFLYLSNWGWMSLLGGDHQRATALTEEAVELTRGRRRGFIGFLPMALDTLGWAALLGGEPERAKSQFEECLSLSWELGLNPLVLSALEGFALVAGEKREAERAARLWGAAQALREAKSIPRDIDFLAEADARISAVRSGMGEEAWEEAVAEGEAMGLDEAIGYALSAETPTKPPSAASEQPSSEQPVALTPREGEIAALVAQGLTNRQVAAQLVISEHTAATHLRRILKKLDLHSRSQLTAWVIEGFLRRS